MRRFVVIVLDGFGIGAMDDAKIVRPGDEKANTLGSILRDHPDLKLPVLEKLGLMNAFGRESSCMKFSPDANYGKSELMAFRSGYLLGIIRRIWELFLKSRMCTRFRKRWMQLRTI